MRYHVQARRFRVGAQVADRSQIRVDGDHALEGSRQRQREKAHSRIEIERERAPLLSDHALQKVINQESIHLEKRQITDSKIEATGFVSQISRPGKFEAILLLVQEEKALELGQRITEELKKCGGRVRELGETEGPRKFCAGWNLVHVLFCVFLVR